jgi:tetratricopeptide (TPR) repeat protein
MPTVEQQINLGMSHLQAGRHGEAEELARAAISEEPANAAAQHVLGLALYLQRRYEEAYDPLHLATKLEPKNPLYSSNLAETLRRLRRFEAAVEEFERATTLMPEFLKAHLGYGNTLRDLKRYDKAVARYRLILAINPRHAEAYYHLALTYIEMDREEEAIPLLRKSLALRPGMQEARLSLAGLLEEEGDIEEAVELFKEVLDKIPGHQGALNNLGNLLKTLGRMEEAKDYYNRAIEKNPAAASAYYNLSRAKKGVGDEEEIRVMEEMLDKPETGRDQKVSLHFALGKHYDDIGQFETAFHHFEQGNILDERGEPFNAAVHSAVVDRLINVFRPSFLQQRAGVGSESELPIFILGMPRSGTTLVEQILATHPDVYGAGELKYVGDLVASLCKAVGGNYPDSMYNLDAVSAVGLAEQYLRKIKLLAGKQKYRRITDKMPGNFMHIGLIASLFPKARIVHCVREPLDVCLSCYSQYFTAVMPFAKSLTSLGQYWRDYARIMEHWHAAMPGRIFEVRYSDMIGDQEGTSRKLLEHCGLTWDDACLEFHKTERQVKTASTWQVRQPIYTSSLDRWRNYEKFLDPLIDAMGERYRGNATAASFGNVIAESTSDLDAAQ